MAKKRYRLKKIAFRDMQILILFIAAVLIGYNYLSHRIHPVKEVPPVIEEKEEKPGPTVMNPIDFDTLWDMNEDVYGYIYIDDTEVDYPILQHPSDNQYYLDYTMEKKKGYPGSIYTEKENAKDFSDPNTVVYGHNMENGSMFHVLLEYRDEEFFNEHPYIYIYTPEYILQYQVFASYINDDSHLLNTYDFKDKNVFDEYLKDIKDKDKVVINNDIEVNNDSQIITLSTCTYNSSTRNLVLAVLSRKIECQYKTETILKYGEKELEKSKVIPKEETNEENQEV